MNRFSRLTVKSAIDMTPKEEGVGGNDTIFDLAVTVALVGASIFAFAMFY
jgi:hypothetical protein